eukprot:gene20868-biopygen13147
MAGGRRTESTGATAGLWLVADGRSPRLATAGLWLVGDGRSPLEPLQGYGWWPTDGVHGSHCRAMVGGRRTESTASHCRALAGGRRTESTGATAGLWLVADGRSPREPLQGYGWWPTDGVHGSHCRAM